MKKRKKRNFRKRTRQLKFCKKSFTKTDKEKSIRS